MNRAALLQTTVLFAAMLLIGCAEPRFSRKNFDLIRVGVDERPDVRQILGPPTSTFADSDQWYYEDLDRYCSALIHFATDGKVSGKQWMDSATGEWSGDNPHADRPPQGEVREQRTGTRTIDDD